MYSFAGDGRVLEGHSFIVEAAVSVGGRDIRQGINVYRFANRIPLLFEVRDPLVWCFVGQGESCADFAMALDQANFQKVSFQMLFIQLCF